ncbi:protein PTST, chloroplastic isoform X2 [Lactuca sativa]|uniref:protein PTST, chloroplastic isoform X2 n=1 Tax=Lactuca sativa TaxID=4236 RepID=UPI0022AE8C09|nr:protein PTST, chloroplastic isoform X2 [Lactuca sativa]XP_052626592.1 protein PTST, chloroplastic isoform X2 [Lactuca sativa]
MECYTMSTSIQGLLSGNKQISWILWPNRSIHGFQYIRNVHRYPHCRLLCFPPTLNEQSSSLQSKKNSNGDDEHVLEQPIDNDQLKALLADAERAKLLRKLSEANQHNRYLKRQVFYFLLVKEDALAEFKSELAVTELEIQGLLNMAKEIVSYGIPAGSRKINGKYIQSLLLLQLQGVQEKLKKQIKEVELAQSKEVSLHWYGMAESVQVMGSFDGWSHGEDLSAEYTGSYTSFSTSIMLRPGRIWMGYQMYHHQDTETRMLMMPILKMVIRLIGLEKTLMTKIMEKIQKKII